jgi:hypothetical protein
MKTTFLSTLLITVIPSLLFSQVQLLEKAVVSPNLLKQQVKFKVTDTAKDTAARVAVVGKFRLNPGENKAVALTGTAITKLDRSVLPMLKEAEPQAKVFMLPELYYAKVEGTNEQISYRILFIDSAPLKYDDGKELFEGSIRFIPIEVKDSGNTQPVQKALSVPEEIIVSYGIESIPLSIKQINWPPMDVTVTASDPLDSVQVKVLTVSNPVGYPQNLRVEPAIILSSTRTTIQGLGIQTLPVHVALKGVSTYKPVPVTVETSLGTIDSASLMLTGDQPREVILRSESLGKINLKVINPNYRSNTISVEAVFPWLFLLLSILGGLLGGLGKNLLGREKVTVRPLALGSIIGLIAAVAYWGLGIVLIGFSVETRGLNEAMVFGFGLLAGFFGLKLSGK